jgi:hypothetical protein
VLNCEDDVVDKLFANLWFFLVNSMSTLLMNRHAVVPCRKIWLVGSHLELKLLCG